MEKEIEDIIVHTFRTSPEVEWWKEAAHAIAERMKMKEGILVEATDVYVWNRPNWGWELTIRRDPIHSAVVIDSDDWESVYRAGRHRGRLVIYKEKNDAID